MAHYGGLKRGIWLCEERQPKNLTVCPSPAALKEDVYGTIDQVSSCIHGCGFKRPSGKKLPAAQDACPGARKSRPKWGNNKPPLPALGRGHDPEVRGIKTYAANRAAAVWRLHHLLRWNTFITFLLPNPAQDRFFREIFSLK